jgi:hypothetical protein
MEGMAKQLLVSPLIASAACVLVSTHLLAGCMSHAPSSLHWPRIGRDLVNMAKQLLVLRLLVSPLTYPLPIFTC